MTLKVNNISVSSNCNFRGVKSSDNDDNSVAFKKFNIPKKTDKKIETKVFFTTLAGVLTSLAFIMKKKGFSLSPSKIFKTKVKDWGILKIKEYNEFDIEKLAVGSVSGGLIGGFAFDKKANRKAKIREAVIQMIGNITTPVLCVSAGAHLYKKYEKSIMEGLNPILFKENGKKLPMYVNKAIKCVPGIGTVALCLATGIIVGSIVGNAINHKIFHRNDTRKIRIDDFSAHIDDTCLAVSLVAKGDSPIGFLNKVVPAALMVAGVSTGVAQEKKLS